MQPLGALPASRATPHNSSHREGMVHIDKTWKGQDRDGGGVWIGAGGGLAHNTSSTFPPEPPGASGSIIPVYCALLGTVVLGLLAYVAFKCWPSHKQRQQLAKAQTAVLGALDRSQIHGDSSVFLDSPSSLQSSAPARGHILSLAAGFTLISLSSSKRKWRGSWECQANLTRAGRPPGLLG